MFLPKGFGGADTDSQDMQLNNMDDVMHESRMAEQFCLVHGADTQKARWMMLFVEEMAGNIILHGKPHKSASAAVDCRLFVHEGRICLSLRDYCEYFDPTRYYEIHQNDAPGESTGIRMVMKLAKEVRYYNAFNSNNLLVYLD